MSKLRLRLVMNDVSVPSLARGWVQFSLLHEYGQFLEQQKSEHAAKKAKGANVGARDKTEEREMLQTLLHVMFGPILPPAVAGLVARHIGVDIPEGKAEWGGVVHASTRAKMQEVLQEWRGTTITASIRLLCTNLSTCGL